MTSYTAAAKAIRALGFKVSKSEDGEIRVSWPLNEGAAYYTDCPDDALATAQIMASERAPEADMVEIDGEEVEIAALSDDELEEVMEEGLMTHWINHTTNSCPCDPRLWVDVMRADGTIDPAFPAIVWDWEKDIDGVSPILAWRESTIQSEHVPYGSTVVIRDAT